MSVTWTLGTMGLQSARREAAGAWRGYAMAFGAWAAWPDEAVPYPGAQAALVQQELATAASALVDVPLHEVLDDATDAGVLRHVASRLSVQGRMPWARLRLQSTPMSGAEMAPDGGVVLWRRYRLRCAHYLPHVPLGHKCGRLHGHDFEVVVHARISDGLADHDALDVVWAPWHMRLNYQQLNALEGLDNPTSECLSAWLWQGLRRELPSLVGVTVFETASCGAHFDGDAYRIWKDFSFDSATRLSHAPKDAAERQIHGHTYRLRLVMKAPLDAHMGWVIDFGDVKKAFAPVFDAFDHRPLHEMPGLSCGDLGTMVEALHGQTKAVLPVLERTLLRDGDGVGSECAETDEFIPLPL